jgi:hypothetical protein
MATGGFRVRLNDGSEMDLDSDMVRSWYEQGLIHENTPMRAPGSRNWQRMDEVVEMRGWKQPDRSSRSEDGDEDEEEAGPQKWRSYVASGLLFGFAGAAGYLWFFPERWTPALAPVPWREIGLGALVLALSLIRGWPIGRMFARLVMLVAAFALFPLAGLLIAQGVRGLPLLVLLSAWVVASGFIAFLGAAVATASAVLFLVTILLGAAGVYYFGYVPPGTSPPVAVQTTLPAPPAPPHTVPVAPTSSPATLSPAASAAPGPGLALAVRAATQEVPLLSPQAAELLMSRSAAQVLEPPEVFRRAYGLVGRGLYALSRPESKEMGDLHASIYASLPPTVRGRLGDYIDRARSRYSTTPEEDRQMSQVMKSAVLSLPADKRARLQELFEKAMTAGLEK